VSSGGDCSECFPDGFEPFVAAVDGAFKKTQAFIMTTDPSFCEAANDSVCGEISTNYGCCCKEEITSYTACVFDQELAVAFGLVGCTSNCGGGDDEESDDDGSSMMYIIIGVVVGILLCCCCCGCYYYRIRRKNKTTTEVKIDVNVAGESTSTSKEVCSCMGWKLAHCVFVCIIRCPLGCYVHILPLFMVIFLICIVCE
jgi:hypothetical protein